MQCDCGRSEILWWAERNGNFHGKTDAEGNDCREWTNSSVWGITVIVDPASELS